MSLSRLTMRWWLLALVPVVLFFSWRLFSAPPPAPPLQPLPEDPLFHPDLVIQSRSLSQLPKDILTVPLLNKLLTEEFVFYYERNESRLSLEGTFRRIAYEHNMGIGDEIIAYALNTPAQVALWKNKDGKLKNFLLVLPKKGLLRFLEAAARIALDDTQLTEAASIQLDNGEAYTVWRVQQHAHHAIYFVALHDYLAVFTDPNLLDIGEKGERRSSISQFIHTLGPDSVGSWLRLPPLAGKHTIAARASYLSFGYQHFFPALDTVRFDDNDSGWSTSILSSAPFAPPDDLWERIPASPALCLALPTDTNRLLNYLHLFSSDPALPELVDNLRPPAALCWYGDSQLHTPLAVFPLKKTKPAWYPLLGDLFAKGIGTKEATGERLPVVESTCPGGQIWHRPVSSAHAPLDARRNPAAADMRSKRYFDVTFALVKDTLIFSPDATLAERAVAVLNRTYPPLSETLDRSLPPVSMVVEPKAFTVLLRNALTDSLPSTREQVFRTSVEQRFFPLLDTVATMPAFVLTAPHASNTWEPLLWRDLSSPSP